VKEEIMNVDYPAGVDPVATDAASEADRQWFEAHPEAEYRTRPAMRGEMPDVDEGDSICVIQIEPGFRVRYPIESTTGRCVCRHGR
jgi:hypothetical protein